MPVESITAFNGGLVTRPAPHLLATNEAVVVENCHIWDGSIRPMLAAVLAASIPTGCQSIYKFNGAWEGSLGERWYAEENNVLYWADGGIPQKKRASDGEQVRLGIIMPSATLTATPGIAHGKLVSPLKYALTYFSDPLLPEDDPSGWGGESAPMTQDVTFDPTLTGITFISAQNYDANGTIIELVAGITSDLIPEGGYVKVASTGEIIRYSYIESTSSTYLMGCERGALGTVAKNFTAGDTVNAYGVSQVTIAGVPVSEDEQVNSRRFYRLRAGQYRLSGALPENVSLEYVDSIEDEDLRSIVLPTRNDVSLLYDPPEDVDGVCGPYNGMLFGWKDKTVYWSEVGLPDAWPALNQFTYRTAVAACMVFGGAVVVLCEDAPYTISGTDPDNLYRSDALSQQGCLYGRTAVKAGPALLYLSPDGVCAFDGRTSPLISSALAKSDFDLTDPYAAYHDEQYMLFHEDGCIIGDFRDGQPIWRTCTETGLSAYRDPSVDTLYIGRADGVYEWEAGPSLPWRYWSGELAAGSLAQSKDFWFLILHAVGQFRCQLFVDGDNLHDDTETLSEREPYRVRLGGSSRGYRPQLRLEGSGTVYAVEIEHSGPGRSR